MADSTYDVVVVGGGPAGSSAAAFSVARGLRTLLLEREKFPREKVCGDCLNPACWPVLQRLNISEQVRSLPHGRIDHVEFIGLNGQTVAVSLPDDENAEIAVKRSLFDALLLERARELGAEISDETTLTGLTRSGDLWIVKRNDQSDVRAQVVIAADGRNSTVARLLNLLPHFSRERVALQAHVPLPSEFGNRVVLQWLPGGYSGQVPVNDTELNLCLVGRAHSIRALKDWATNMFHLSAAQPWRSVTPLTRAPLPTVSDHLLLVGDAARVVEPFTGEGIFYAIRSGEIASAAAEKFLKGDSASAAKEFTAEHRAMYRGRLWINGLARLAVVSSSFGSGFFYLARFNPAILRLLTAKIIA